VLFSFSRFFAQRARKLESSSSQSRPSRLQQPRQQDRPLKRVLAHNAAAKTADGAYTKALHKQNCYLFFLRISSMPALRLYCQNKKLRTPVQGVL